MRVHFAPGYRIYFAEHAQDIIILLLGGDKTSQKYDIEKALSCWKDYERQYNERD